jgi:acyl-CoA thioesterase
VGQAVVVVVVQPLKREAREHQIKVTRVAMLIAMPMDAAQAVVALALLAAIPQMLTALLVEQVWHQTLQGQALHALAVAVVAHR